MNKSLCNADCENCPSREGCRGCENTCGNPFGKQCFIAKYILIGGIEKYLDFKKQLLAEINSLNIEGMERVSELYPLEGSFVNLEYPIHSGTVKFLNDDEMYLCAQVKNIFDESGKTCFGIVARENFILICSYGENGENPEIEIYKKR